MSVIKLFRLLRGYVIFRACSGFNDRFINHCAMMKIALWDVSVDHCGITACMYASDYKKLRAAAKASGASVRIYKKHGLFFFLRNNKTRVGFLAGACVFVLMIFTMSAFVWTVDIEGNTYLYSDELIELLATLGVSPGKPKAKIDTDEIENRLSVILENSVYWSSLNIEGSCARLELRELPPLEEDKAFGSPCNVVADFDGVITHISVLGGKSAVKIGSAVHEGDLLISGVIENKDLSTSVYEARGEITARRTRMLSADASKSNIKKYVSFTTNYTANFFGIELPLGKQRSQEDDWFVDTRSLVIGGITLPSTLRRDILAYSEAAVLSKEQTELICLGKYFFIENESFRNTLIISKTVSTELNSVICIADCIEYIGVQRAINLSEN